MEQDSHPPRQALPVLFLVLIAGIVGGVAGAVLALKVSHNDSAPAPEAASTVEQQYVTLNESSAITSAAQKALPSVVTITNNLGADASGSSLLTGQSASGSGVIIDDRGYIITNQHVVQNAGQLTVDLYDGREFPATLVSSDDPFTDLAVIKIDADGLQALPWGDSDALKPGQEVVAIGSALSEFRDSVTTGVVSGLHRRWMSQGVYMEDLIQTDAAVNHGNSGGALLNAEGELVGLNTSVIRSTDSGEAVEGIAFAISSNVAAPIAKSIIDSGSYPRAYLGVSHEDLTPQVGALAGFADDHGAAVVSVTAGSPAADAGIQQGDVILRMGDIDVNQDMPFINALGRLTPGQTIPVVFDRDGKQMTVNVTPQERQRATQ